MNHSRSSSGRPFLSHQDQILNTICEYHYIAPHILARNEEQAQMQRDVALDAQRVANRSAAAWRPLVQEVRHHLGGMLIRVGTRIQDRPRTTVRAPSTISPTGRASV